MAAPSETAALAVPAAAAHGSGWIAGIIATLTETHRLFDQSPTLGFIAMGLLGAFAGWALAIESGKFDEIPTRRQMMSLLRRTGIGIAIGVAVGVWWADQPGASRGMWMLVAGIVAAAPVDLFRTGLDLLTTFLRQRITGKSDELTKP